MKLILLLIFLLIACEVSAGNKDSTIRWQPSGLGIHAGITGVGGHLAWKLSGKPRLVLRLGGTYVGYNQSNVLDIGGGSKIDFYPNIVIGMVQSSVKWHPFRRGSIFLTGGVAYTWRPDLRLKIKAQNKLDLGGISMKAEEFGTVGLGLKWSNVIGYAGFGMGRSIPKRRFGVGFELGCFYLGKPQVLLDLDGFLETTTLEEQVPMIEKNMRGYRYLPNLQIVFTYALVKKAWR